MKKKSTNTDLILVRRELDKVGLGDYVGVSCYKMENERGKMVPHIVATYNEIVVDTFSWRTTGEKSYMYEDHMKAEEMNRYFCAELFVKGITQRAEWIKADFEDKVAYLTENEFGHPALFPAWKKKQKAIE
jgi:hypothetical protein